MPHELNNFRLLAHDTLAGFGEGVSLQVAPGGRRVLWMAHECAPKNFTGVDVTDPRHPRVVVQTELPHRNVRSNSLEVCDNLMAVAYQTGTHGATPAGIELFDISKPEEPRSVGFFDCSGPASRGVHQLWFVDGKTIHCSSGAADFTPRNLLDDQFYRAIDVSDPTKPRELGRWWYPGTREGDDAPPVPRHPQFDTGYRAHNTNVYPDRPDRAYIGYIDGGAIILDISDIGAPKQVGHWNPHPPFPGFLHTLMPIPNRDLLVAARKASTGPKWSGCSTAAVRTTWSVSARCRYPRWKTTPISAAATARTTCGRTAPARPSIPARCCSAPGSAAACACTT
jgi:hypothetical protein